MQKTTHRGYAPTGCFLLFGAAYEHELRLRHSIDSRGAVWYHNGII